MIPLGHNAAKDPNDRGHWVFIDPALHLAVSGKTRTGKSTLLEGLALEIIGQGDGLLAGDPHGPLVAGINAKLAPADRPRVFEFSRARPCPLNFFAAAEPALAVDAAWGFLQHAFNQPYAPASEDLFRMTLFTLYDLCPLNLEETYNVPTFALASRWLSDPSLRARFVPQIKDDELRLFWEMTFDGDKVGGWDKRMRADKTAPIQNKLRVFSDPLFRPIFSSGKCLDFREKIDRSAILLFDLSQSEWGEGRSSFLGSVIAYLHQRALVSRKDVLDRGEKPVPSYAIWDEFLNFLHSNIKTYLAEAGKFGGSLTLASQTFAPFPLDTLHIALGNVGTFVIFRVGHADAEIFANEFGDEFTPTALKRLRNYHAYVQTVIEGVPQTPPAHIRAFPPRRAA